MITVEIHSDDYKYSTDFDATPWAEDASDEAILELVACDYRSDYAADAVAQGVDDPFIKQVLDYAQMTEDMGYEVSVNEEELLVWLKDNRKSLWLLIMDND